MGVADMLNPLDKILGLIDVFIDEANKLVETFLASNGVQCLLGFTEPIRDVAALAACPVDELVETFQSAVNTLLGEVIAFMDAQAENMIATAVDSFVRDELEFTIPNFLDNFPAPPSDVWLAQCTAQKVDSELGVISGLADKVFEVAGFSEYRHYLDEGVKALESLPCHITAADIERHIVNVLNEKILLDGNVETHNFGDACADAWEDLKRTDMTFDSCIHAVEDLWNGAGEFVGDVADAAQDGLYDAADAAQDGLYAAADAAQDGLYAGADAAREWVGGLY